MKNINKILLIVLLISIWAIPMATPALACGGSTYLDISASATEVSSGDTIKLTINETNDGDIRLDMVSVDLYEGSTLLMTLSHGSTGWVGGDNPWYGDLDIGETWKWEVEVTVITNTTYTAIGYAEEAPDWASGEPPVTWPTDEDEKDSIDVTVIDEECGPCEGKVTTLTLKNIGDAGHVVVLQKKGDVVVYDDEDVPAGGEFSFTGVDKKGTLGTEIIILVDGEENVRIHTSCSQPIGIGMVFGDFEIIDGASRNGGKLCPDNTTVPPDNEECGPCEGKVTTLTLKNIGDAGHVVVLQKKGDVVVYDDEDVPAGGEFSFTGVDKKGTLGTEIIILVDGEENVRIHTSCSQPIGIGMVFGDFEIIDGASRNGGDFCLCPPSP